MTALEIELAGGKSQKVIYRQPNEETIRSNPHAAEDEFQILAFLQRLKIRAPAPIHLVPTSNAACENNQSGNEIPARGLLIEFIEGEPEFAPKDPIEAAQQMAEYLALIHTVDCSLADLSFLRRTDRCEELSFFLGKGSGLTLSDRLFARSPFAAYLPEIIAHLRAANQKTTRNKPTLLHGDFWPGNLLWRQGRLIAAIDWEDAHIGDPLSDLSIARLDMLYIYGAEAVNTFTLHYHSMNPVDFSSLPHWDLCAALRLSRLIGTNLPGWADFYGQFDRTDITAQVISDYFGSFTGQALQGITS